MARNGDRRVPRQVEDQPGEAVAEDGVVLLDGPGGVAVSLTPAAASQTAASLMRAADEARRQHTSKA